MTLAVTRAVTWETLLALPEHDPGALRYALASLWRPSGSVRAWAVDLFTLAGLRACIGLTQSEMGALVARYMSRCAPFAASTVSVWEWYERHPVRGMRQKYAAGPDVRAAYDRIAVDALALRSGGRALLRMHGGWRRVVVWRACACGREFMPKTWKHVKCSRCGNTRKRANRQCTKSQTKRPHPKRSQKPSQRQRHAAARSKPRSRPSASGTRRSCAR